jgi:hypothetical protein
MAKGEQPGESAEMADEPSTPDPASDPTPEDPPAAETAPEPEGEEKMPPELKAIIDKERKAARDAASDAKKKDAALAKALKELETFRESQLSDQEKAVKAAREEGIAEGRSAGNARLIRAEVLAAASGKLANPTHAFAILTDAGALKDVEVGDDGQLDTAPIVAAVEELVKNEPHLAAVRDPQFGNRQPVDGAPVSTDAAFDAFLRSHR